jgi:hypothetical protein
MDNLRALHREVINDQTSAKTVSRRAPPPAGRALDIKLPAAHNTSDSRHPPTKPGPAALFALVLCFVFGLVLSVYGCNCLVTQRASLPARGFIPQSWRGVSGSDAAGIDAVALGIGYIAGGVVFTGLPWWLTGRTEHNAWRVVVAAAFLVAVVCLYFVIVRYFVGLIVRFFLGVTVLTN